MEPLLHFVINICCKTHRLDDAAFAFETMKKLIDGRPSVVIYNMLINGYVKIGDFEKALDFYQRMLSDKVKPDVFTFNILISGFCRNGRFNLGLHLFGEMREKGCTPNVVTFNTLIKGFFRESKFNQGVKMVYEMIELGCDLSSVTCDIIGKGRFWRRQTLSSICRERVFCPRSLIVLSLWRSFVVKEMQLELWRWWMMNYGEREMFQVQLLALLSFKV